MLKRAIYLKPVIQSFIIARTELREYQLMDREWELAEFLMLFLEPFHQTTMQLQGTARPTLQQTFITYEQLFNQLDNVKAIFASMSIVPTWFHEICLRPSYP